MIDEQDIWLRSRDYIDCVLASLSFTDDRESGMAGEQRPHTNREDWLAVGDHDFDSALVAHRQVLKRTREALNITQTGVWPTTASVMTL